MNIPILFPASLKEEILNLKNKGMFLRIRDDEFYKDNDLLDKSNLNITQNGFILYQDKSLFIYNFVPDNASVKDKLLYANGEMILLKELGTHVVFINKLTDATFEKSFDEKVLTHDELHKQQVRKEEMLMDMSRIKLVGSGIPFSLTSELQNHLNSEAILMTIKDETVGLYKSVNSFTEFITALKESQIPMYGYFNETKLFISYCPESAGVKDRMLFTTAKNHVQSFFPKDINKIEASAAEELPASEEQEELQQEAVNQQRRKVAAPGKRRLL
eukprot:NODE_75_length_23373_cov_0.434261.p8 type:complete len:273 gc:universal NODE_75_length_23373_cov_0.434261:6045-6863(+)